ncbi:Kelch repeat-containing protein [Pleomorphovibrio marinus]|uniref:Kelch repeat-containing protein n=1 Tax=Pleomorphovibrio marinus TaxID=2164132 RepID=UPI000E0B9860|nr:kelch repeat-containing protein [Pleomorphovibrio marinus]
MKHLSSQLSLFLMLLSTPLFAQSWETLDPVNTCTERHECASAAVNGKVYLMGGRGADKPVEEYDPNTNKWTEKSKAPLELHHYQALVFEDKIYVIGAFTGGFPHETPVPNVYIYDPATDEWTKGHEIPEGRRRGAAGVVLHNEKFYVVGGIEDGHWADNRDYLDEYDPRTGDWKKLADLPRVRDHFQAVVVDNKLYAVGGRKSFAKEGHSFELTYGEVDVYDFSSGEWETLGESEDLPTQRAGSSTIAYKEGFIVVGGESIDQVAAHDEVEYFAPDKGWTLLNRLQRGRHGFQVVEINGDYYVAAGCGNRGGSPELSSIEVMQ